MTTTTTTTIDLITENELYDAMTAFVKNDWRTTRKTRWDGIQVGNSGWFLITTQRENKIIYLHDKDYDLSNFRFDVQNGKDSGEKWSLHYTFSIGDKKTIKGRKEFSKDWSYLMNRDGMKEVA